MNKVCGHATRKATVRCRSTTRVLDVYSPRPPFGCGTGFPAERRPDPVDAGSAHGQTSGARLPDYPTLSIGQHVTVRNEERGSQHNVYYPRARLDNRQDKLHAAKSTSKLGTFRRLRSDS